MLLESEMRDGCDKCRMVGGMSSRVNSSSSRMRKKRNIEGWRSIET